MILRLLPKPSRCFYRTGSDFPPITLFHASGDDRLKSSIGGEAVSRLYRSRIRRSPWRSPPTGTARQINASSAPTEADGGVA